MVLSLVKFRFVALALVVSLAGCNVYTPMQSSLMGVEEAGAGGAAASGSGAAGMSNNTAGSTGGSSSGGRPSDGEEFPASSCQGGECWWSATRDACRTAGVPAETDRPAAQENETSLPNLYFGWNRIWIGETDLMGTASMDAWQSFGFDLDGMCTNSKSCPEVQNVQACKPGSDQIPFDGELCRDNTFASLQPVAAAVPEIGERFGISEMEFNCNLWRGSYTVVTRLSGYNGEANDADVRVDVYISPGTEREQPWRCPDEDFASRYPIWRLSEKFKVDPTNFVGEAAAEGELPDSDVSDPHGFVRDGYLVFKVPDGAVVRLAGDGTRYRGFALKTYKGIYTSRLERAQDGRWHMHDGMVGGRVLGQDLIKSFRQIGLCQGVGLDGFYDSVVEYIEQNSDVLADGDNDPERACDAMSFGIGFEGSQLTVGAHEAATPIVECCEPGVAIEDCDPKCGDGRMNGEEKCDTAIAAGEPGACPTACPAVEACMTFELVSEGCGTECKATPISAIGPADGCCPMGADATADRDCAAVCGNGVIEPGETCDPQTSCPVCKVPDMCLAVSATGSADSCNISCTISPVSACAAGDGCCPEGCSAEGDSDCSTSCGNGSVEPNETCDGNGDNACPTNCDDGVACTVDYTSGSPGHCNVVCTNVPVTAALSGDGCCPPGASANTDSDCVAECGNGKTEQGEECDDGNRAAGDGCTAECKRESPIERCIAQLEGDRLPECARCNCEKCQDRVLECYASDSPADNELCTSLVECGLTRMCASETCYCGTSPLTSCIFGTGNGPCKAEVEAAGRTSIPGDLVTRSTNTSYPLGRANTLAACARENCATECAIMNP